MPVKKAARKRTVKPKPTIWQKTKVVVIKYKWWIIGGCAALLLVLWFFLRKVDVTPDDYDQIKQQRDRAYEVIESLMRDTEERRIADSIEAKHLLDSILGLKQKTEYKIRNRNEVFDRFIRDGTTIQKQQWLDSIFPPH